METTKIYTILQNNTSWIIFIESNPGCRKWRRRKQEYQVNKTGLQPVSRTEEQDSLLRGLGVGAKAHCCQGYANRQIDRQTGMEAGGCKVP